MDNNTMQKKVVSDRRPGKLKRFFLAACSLTTAIGAQLRFKG
jgi:hypothetical protein